MQMPLIINFLNRKILVIWAVEVSLWGLFFFKKSLISISKKCVLK